MTRIYAKVVADLFHPGHVAFFRAARALGDHLTVCVVPDERVALAKRAPVMNTAERSCMVAACRFVDQVINDGPREITLSFMQERGFDIYAVGAIDDAEWQVKLRDCATLPPSMVVRLPYLPGISTSVIIARLKDRLNTAT
jgi:cytidyltransferase-like protein